MIYLDNNATTRPLDPVVRAMHDALTNCWHNPSSVHRAGQAARQKVELARRAVADLIGAKPLEVVFTSGGTESIDMAIRGALYAAPKSRRAIVTSPIEHSAIKKLVKTLETRGEAEIRWLPVDHSGVVNLDAARSLIDDSVALVSVQWANNETGAIQPVEELGELAHSRGAAFHCDGTQWVGKMPTSVANTTIDLLTCAAHKMHGPKGVGALYARKGVRIQCVLHGAQELSRRGGTENVPGIVGFGEAARLAREWIDDPRNIQRAASLRDYFENAVIARVPGARLNGPEDSASRLWSTSNIAFPCAAGADSELMILLLSERGVCASAGSACSSGSMESSSVLAAMGLDDCRVHQSIRFSICRETTKHELDEAVEIVAQCANKLGYVHA
jgi:cysteine desulfurase